MKKLFLVIALVAASATPVLATTFPNLYSCVANPDQRCQ
jgi:hypothetical protein